MTRKTARLLQQALTCFALLASGIVLMDSGAEVAPRGEQIHKYNRGVECNAYQCVVCHLQ